MPAQAHHEHLICERCGRVVEFPNERLERMLPVIADEHGFQHERHRVEIYGVCRECRQRELGAAVSEPATLGLLVAFAAGLLSFLSPCVLPLVPSYIGFLTGMSLPEMGGRRRVALLHALLFVLGFSLVFVLLGASATALGRALNYYQLWLQRIGGVLIIVFGLVCLGVIKVAVPEPGAAGPGRAEAGGLSGLGAGGHGVRGRVDAVHRAGARRDPGAGRHVAGPQPRHAAARRRTPRGWPCRF